MPLTGRYAPLFSKKTLGLIESLGANSKISKENFSFLRNELIKVREMPDRDIGRLVGRGGSSLPTLKNKFNTDFAHLINEYDFPDADTFAGDLSGFKAQAKLKEEIDTFKEAQNVIHKKVIAFQNSHRDAISGKSLSESFIADLTALLATIADIRTNCDSAVRTANRINNGLTKISQNNISQRHIKLASGSIAVESMKDALKNPFLVLIGMDEFKELLKGKYVESRMNSISIQLLKLEAQFQAVWGGAAGGWKGEKGDTGAFDPNKAKSAPAVNLEDMINAAIADIQPQSADLGLLKTELEAIITNVRGTMTASNKFNLKRYSNSKRTLTAGPMDTVKGWANKLRDRNKQDATVDIDTKVIERIKNSLLNLKKQINTGWNINMLNDIIKNIDGLNSGGFQDGGTATDDSINTQQVAQLKNTALKQLTKFLPSTNAILTKVNDPSTASVDVNTQEGYADYVNYTQTAIKDLNILGTKLAEVNVKIKTFIDKAKSLRNLTPKASAALKKYTGDYTLLQKNIPQFFIDAGFLNKDGEIGLLVQELDAKYTVDLDKWIQWSNTVTV